DRRAGERGREPRPPDRRSRLRTVFTGILPRRASHDRRLRCAGCHARPGEAPDPVSRDPLHV
ncbi:MAG: hypothetical protein AVDCRST_MAG64-2995, partial [uncultured Phycisphaerae bacterium]